MRCLGFRQNFIPFICTLILEYESTNGLNVFSQNCISEKTLVLELWYKIQAFPGQAENWRLTSPHTRKSV